MSSDAATSGIRLPMRSPGRSLQRSILKGHRLGALPQQVWRTKVSLHAENALLSHTAAQWALPSWTLRMRIAKGRSGRGCRPHSARPPSRCVASTHCGFKWPRPTSKHGTAEAANTDANTLTRGRGILMRAGTGRKVAPPHYRPSAGSTCGVYAGSIWSR